jgi:hypothetical protein
MRRFRIVVITRDLGQFGAQAFIDEEFHGSVGKSSSVIVIVDLG